jgi:MOSC domain-containing protein YiiM
MQTGEILSVNTSVRKGTVKRPVPSALLLTDFGIEGDAHAGVPNDGGFHRQLSLLADESVETLRAKGMPDIRPGDFGENLTIRGVELRKLPVGTKISAGEALLEVTQIGKECRQGCEIRRITGDCVMPREGVFARVLRGGIVRPGDRLFVLS